MSTAPKLLEIDYCCLKTELSLSLPGSQEQSDDQVLELSLFDQQTHPNANASYSFNINTRDSTGKGGLVLPDYSSSDMKWGLSVNAGSQSQLVIEKGASLFSHGAGTCKVVNVLEIGSGVCKKPVQLKDMDIDVVASDSDKPPPMAKKPTATDPAAKAQVIGWPPIRSFRKNSVAAAAASTKNSLEADGKSGMSCLYVKVSMDGAPYLRKVDLKLYKNYKELSLALKKMFSSFTVGLVDSQLNDMHQGSSECVLTYKDKDGDWMLVGDVPWDMFTSTCKRLRIMKGSEATVKGRGQ